MNCIRVPVLFVLPVLKERKKRRRDIMVEAEFLIQLKYKHHTISALLYQLLDYSIYFCFLPA
jgi:hypothetical protein